MVGNGCRHFLPVSAATSIRWPTMAPWPWSNSADHSATTTFIAAAETGIAMLFTSMHNSINIILSQQQQLPCVSKAYAKQNTIIHCFDLF